MHIDKAKIMSLIVPSIRRAMSSTTEQHNEDGIDRCELAKND